MQRAISPVLFHTAPHELSIGDPGVSDLILHISPYAKFTAFNQAIICQNKRVKSCSRAFCLLSENTRIGLIFETIFGNFLHIIFVKIAFCANVNR